MFNNKRFNKKGYTLIELLLALGISAILIIMIFLVYVKVSSEKIVNTEIAKINTIAAGIENLYAGKPSFKGLKQRTLIDSEVFPDNMLVKEDGVVVDIINGFGGRVDVGESGYWKDNSFMISYKRVYGDSCFKLPLALDQSFEVINLGINSVKHPSKNDGLLDKKLLIDTCKAAEDAGFTYEIQFVR